MLARGDLRRLSLSRLAGGTLLGMLLLCGSGCGDVSKPEDGGPVAPVAGSLVDLGATPAPIDLHGAPAIVTPPAGPWRYRAESLTAGQWFAQYLSEDGATLMRAFVFPTQQTSDPVTVLMQAVDTFFRSLGVEGFGLPSRKALSVWGAPAADARLNAAVGGVRVDGTVRLLLAAPDTWALAIGYAPQAKAAELDQVVRSFAQSLEPSEPRFFERRFRDEAELASIVLKPADEEPLTGADVAAILLLLEAGADRRVPLAVRAVAREVLVAEARAVGPAGRQAYRDAALAFPKFLVASAEERSAGLRALGSRMLEGLFARANERDEAALRFATLWQRLGEVAIGTPEDGLTVGNLGSLNEMAVFLASVAGDAQVETGGAEGGALQAELRAGLSLRWPDLSAEEKEALVHSDAQWAHLRRAWDEAAPEDRAVFRRALAAELAPAELQEHVAGLDPGRALMRWIQSQPTAGTGPALVRRAFALTAGERAELIGLLGVEERPFSLGW